MPNKIRQKPKLDPWVKAWSPIYVVLCRDGKPHCGSPVGESLMMSQRDKMVCNECLTCSPHRVQAYRPMI